MRLGRGIRVFLMAVGAATVSLAVVVLLLLVAAAPGPSVPDGATLVLRPGGDLPERAGDGIAARLGLESGGTVRDLVASLDAARRDPRIARVLLRPAGLATPYWAGVQELRDALLRFRASGKPVTAFLEYGSDRDYYLATAADEVLLVPTSPLDLTGVASYEIFLGGLLEEVGAEPDFLRVGAYKTAPNQLTETTFTDEHREAIEALNADFYEQLVAGIADARGLTPSDVRALIDRGPFGPGEALAAGLVDGLAYADEVEGASAGASTIAEPAYRQAGRRGDVRPDARVAVLHVTGVIASGAHRFDPLGGTVAGSDSVADDLRRITDDPSFDAVVLRVASPGGSSVASDVIWRALRVARRERPDRPVVASMGEVAASGGYYVAMAADTVVAQPGTITGSIGVYAGKVAIGGTLERLGVGTGAVEAGANAGIQSPFEPFDEAERARLDAYVREFYGTFVERVAEGRGLTAGQVDAVAQGRVWSGASALDHGLVDALGGLDTAVALALAEAGFEEDAEVELVPFPRPRGLYEVLVEQFGTPARATAALDVLDALGLGAGRRALGALTAPARLFHANEPLALLPFTLVP